MAPIEKTLAKLRQSIAEGNFYEAHQMYRTVSNRLVKQKNYSDAKAIVYSGAKELLNAGQSGSGLDLAMLLLELYQLSTTPVCDDTVGPLVELFRAFPVKSGDNQRYDYIKAVIKWSSKFGYYESGDPVLQHEIGAALYGSYAEAETFLINGTMSSAKLLASMLEQWSVADNGDQNSLATVIMYLVRVIFKQLLAKRPDNATLCFKFFIDSYNSSLTVVDKAEVEGAPESFQVFKHPLMNFLQLLLVSIERRSVETFKSTKSRYGQVLQQVYPESEKLFVEIGKMYFNIHPQTPMGQLNLNNLLGAMFGGQ